MTKTNNAVTLKEWANIAIAKHAKQVFKYETGVIKDRDPEDLHQMRVGMRRLRSAIAGFAIALDLPKTVNEKKIAKIGRSLGKLRDLDVLLAALINDYRPLLPAGEQKSLDKAIKFLKKQRKRELKQVRTTLKSKLYLHLKQGLQNWLQHPTYQVIGELFIYPVLPDLLLPQISQLLLHPGWLVGVELKKGKIQVPETISKKEVEQLLEQNESPLHRRKTNGAYKLLNSIQETAPPVPAVTGVPRSILHDLRKEAKRTRYNLELFSQFYDDIYLYYVKQIEQIQEVLGQIQDGYVLRTVLEKVLKSAILSSAKQGSIVNKMPELATILTKTRYQKWQDWAILQEEFLDDKTRNELRQTIQQPVVWQGLRKEEITTTNH